MISGNPWTKPSPDSSEIILATCVGTPPPRRAPWSGVTDPARDQHELIERTGLWFLEPSESSRRLLGRYIESRGKAENRS